MQVDNLGVMANQCGNQKVNTKSSTETELVGVDDVISNLYFMQEQGDGTTHAIIYQESKSAILLELKNKISSGKQTKHIKVKYFFIADKVGNGDVKVKHTSTYKMWADMNNKPKQGSAFCINHSFMMNCDVELLDETIGGPDQTVEGDSIAGLSSVAHQMPFQFDSKVMGSSHHTLMTSAQECVGCMRLSRPYGDKNSWHDVMMSDAERVSKRLLS